MSQTRRLSAILAADVAGYSRLIGGRGRYSPRLQGDPRRADRSDDRRAYRPARQDDGSRFACCVSPTSLTPPRQATEGCRWWPRLIGGARDGEPLTRRDRNVKSNAVAVAQR